MLRYWTFWNFSWFLGSEFKVFNFNGPLITSIINTSIIGGYMTYIYPRRIVIKIKKKNYELPYYQVVLVDLIFHQIPLIRLFTKKNSPKINKTCGLYSVLPVCTWFYINSYRKIDHDRLYGIKMTKLIASSFIITSAFGLLKHKNDIKGFLQKN